MDGCPFVYMINRQDRLLRFQQKVAQGILRVRFQISVTFVLDYQFKWNKR